MSFLLIFYYLVNLSNIRRKLDSMTEQELTRFEFFSRSHLPRDKVKLIMSDIIGNKSNVSDEMVIIVAGLTKMFIGDVVDLAVDISKELKITEGIRPDQIRYVCFFV